MSAWMPSQPEGHIHPRSQLGNDAEKVAFLLVVVGEEEQLIVDDWAAQ